MKRFHVHISVKSLPESIAFYSKILGAEPTVIHGDYAKWMIEDPRINLAISQRGREAGVNHLGFQVDSEEELKGLRAQVATAKIAAVDEGAAACCYARSDKYWIEDPQGIAWETFHTLGSIPVFGEEAEPAADRSACCVPLAQQPGNTTQAAS